CVFISPDLLNMYVAHAIATNETYRLGVEQIIWYDATLLPSGGDGDLFHEYSDESDEQFPEEIAAEAQESFAWFPKPLPGYQWAVTSPWDGDDAVEEDKSLWHGFRIVTKVLAEEKHNVTELMLDAYQLNTGINHFALNRGTEEYDNFCDIVRRPGFQKLHSLLVGFYLAEKYEIYDKGYLHDALCGATDMRHFSFHTDFATNRHSLTIDMYKYTSLFDVFPIDRWQQLTHFGLSNVLVAKSDLITFLSKLPPTVQTVELSFLTFMEGDGHYISLMEDIRDKLDWKHRPLEGRIKILAKIFCYLSYCGRYICVDKEVEEFVYNDGPQPFQLRQRGNSSDVDPGTGVLKDLFNPAWE
ncbi:unnamed protein product, partial [Fusarium fujikuroi]